MRCNVCVALFRLQCLLVSDEFPAEHIQLVYPEVRGAYLRALEVCDVQRRADQGGAAPPRAEDKSLPAREGQTLLLSSKAQPPLPPGGVAPTTKDRKKKRSDKDKAKDKRERSRSRRRKKKSPSPEKRKRRSKTPERQEEWCEEEGEEEEFVEDDPIPPDDRRGRSPRRSTDFREELPRRGSPERSVRRPRSPPGPPPIRREEQSDWIGPVPAYRRRQEERPPIERRMPTEKKKKKKSKGVKKKRQQKRFKRNRRRIAAKRQH